MRKEEYFKIFHENAVPIDQQQHSDPGCSSKMSKAFLLGIQEAGKLELIALLPE